MNLITRLIARTISLPARLKGMIFGRNSFIGPGYDCLNVRLKGITLGDNVTIGRNAWIQIAGNDPKSKISIGSGTNIGRNAMFSAVKAIKIGKKCLMSYNVSILDHDHHFAKDISPMDSGITAGETVTIGDDCFIGAHTFILKGISLGNHCVVGANSVVTKSYPADSVIVGNPAKLISTLK